jgi:hypothetical protein
MAALLLQFDFRCIHYPDSSDYRFLLDLIESNEALSPSVRKWTSLSAPAKMHHPRSAPYSCVPRKDRSFEPAPYSFTAAPVISTQDRRFVPKRPLMGLLPKWTSYLKLLAVPLPYLALLLTED